MDKSTLYNLLSLYSTVVLGPNANTKNGICGGAITITVAYQPSGEEDYTVQWQGKTATTQDLGDVVKWVDSITGKHFF